MSAEKLKHLEFIQAVITRMNSNSFLIKGWTITLVSALFALAAKDANHTYVLIAYIPIPAFWILDSFYLAQERQYRLLYKEVASLATEHTDFGMDASKFSGGGATWLSAMFSKTILAFYLITFGTTLIVMFLLGR